MRTLIVTAADEGFMPLARGLLASLWNVRSESRFELACLDVGLDSGSRDWLTGNGVKLATPGWDLPVSDAARVRQPSARALTARPFLRDYFPGHDLYMWIDADAWVQEPFAIDWAITAAAAGGMALCPEVDRAYRPTWGVHEWRADRLRRYFGEHAAAQLSWQRYFNAGMFALKADAPHWGKWARWFASGIEHSNSSVVSDQTALNYMLWNESLPIFPLPALCNWLCHLASPHYNGIVGKFCEPLMPRQTLGILHLTGGAKDGSVIYTDVDGNRQDMSLRCPIPATKFQHQDTVIEQANS